MISRRNLPIKTRTKNFLAEKRVAPATIPSASKKGFGIKANNAIANGVYL